MINIALINHISVIYCGFLTLGSERETLENITVECTLPLHGKFGVFSGYLNKIMVLWSTTIIQRTINAPYGSLLGYD